MDGGVRHGGDGGGAGDGAVPHDGRAVRRDRSYAVAERDGLVGQRDR